MLFGSSSVCQRIPVNDSLVIGDPDHHECAFFKVNVMNTSEESDSENKPVKNFLKANFELISVDLDIDWSSLLECGLEEGVAQFYTVINESVDRNVPDRKFGSASYPAWYTNELKDLINQKKELHAILKNTNLLKDSREYIEFSAVRAKCLRLPRELYKLHLCKIESNNYNTNLKCFWSYVHRFKKGYSLPQLMHLRDRYAAGRRSVRNY